MFNFKPQQPDILQQMVEQGTQDTLRGMDAPEIFDLAVKYRETGNEFMCGMVARAVVAQLVDVKTALSVDHTILRRPERRREFGRKLHLLGEQGCLETVHKFATGQISIKQIPWLEF